MPHSIPTIGARLALLVTIIGTIVPAAMLAQSATRAPQSRSWADPAIATLMLVDDLGKADARAVVIRRPGPMPNNIVLVTRSTTPAELAHAVATLIASRRSRGDGVEREMRALIGAAPPSAPPRAVRSSGSSGKGGATAAKPTPSQILATSDLKRLLAAPDFAIPGVGRGPALVIRMKDKARVRTR